MQKKELIKIIIHQKVVLLTIDWMLEDMNHKYLKQLLIQIIQYIGDLKTKRDMIATIGT